MSHSEDDHPEIEDPFRDHKQAAFFNELMTNNMSQEEREFLDTLNEEQLGYVSDLCYELTQSIGINTTMHALRACLILLKKSRN